jgi:hypothetical protein
VVEVAAVAAADYLGSFTPQALILPVVSSSTFLESISLSQSILRVIPNP